MKQAAMIRGTNLGRQPVNSLPADTDFNNILFVYL